MWSICCVKKKKLRRVNFLDLDIRAPFTTIMLEIEFCVNRKPGILAGNDYGHFPCCPYHSRHVFRGCLKAEMHGLVGDYSFSSNIGLKNVVKLLQHKSLQQSGFRHAREQLLALSPL